jgi:XTP/dITP diphosphohydrolase
VTTNPGKVAEARAVLRPLGHDVEAADSEVLEIQADDLATVARFKADHARDRVEVPYFVEDAGLFVDALDGFPGVYSAYAYRTIGCLGILRLLEGLPEPRRAARFEAVIAYRDGNEQTHLFSGRVDGWIARDERGAHGFGFDPIFLPEGRKETFAELPPDEKDAVSHRGRALQAFARHLEAEGTTEKR